MESTNPSKLSLNFPPIGLGTYHLVGQKVSSLILEAYQIGYRHFDTATLYQNEKEIGKALKSIPKNDYKVTSKVWYEDMGYYSVFNAFEKSINNLELNVLDLYLIHWPHPHELIHESLDALKELKKRNLILNYGVSNFTIHHLEEAFDAGFEIAANQVEYHPYLNQQELLDYCHKKNVQLISYCPIARGKVLRDKELLSLAKKYGKTAAQVTLRWQLQKGIIPLPKTENKKRMIENFDIFDFNLTNEEIVQINKLNRDERLVNKKWSHFDY